MSAEPLPDPAVIVLAGAAGSGKSHWAAEHYRRTEVVSSDALRAVVGSGPADLEATADAFELLDRIATIRIGRRLPTVLDTLGLEPGRRRSYLARARDAGLPAVLVIVDTDPRLCRERNARRDRPVPAPALTAQLKKVAGLDAEIAAEGWDVVLRVGQSADPTPAGVVAPVPSRAVPDRPGPRVILQVSRFDWGDRPGPWLADLAAAAREVGFDGLALMDHLIQIPQVGRAWDPIPEPYVSLGFLAGQDTGLRLGTLVSPVTFRAPGIVAKAVATLDCLSGGRAFCGLGVGWWQREHQAYGLAFPSTTDRHAELRRTIDILRGLWAPGTKRYEGRYAELPETTCYPRPQSRIPIIVGGSGEQQTLRIAAAQADGCNVTSDPGTLPGKIAVLRRHCAELGRDPAEVEVTVLDLPVIGRDRDDAADRVERLRGRVSATSYAARHHAGVAADHARRYRELHAQGVGTVFCSLPDLAGADDLERCRPLLAQLD